MPRPPTDIIVKAEPVNTESIYTNSDLETPIYIASELPDIDRSVSQNNKQLRYNRINDSYQEIEREERCIMCNIDTLCLICFCCCLFD